MTFAIKGDEIKQPVVKFNVRTVVNTFWYSPQQYIILCGGGVITCSACFISVSVKTDLSLTVGPDTMQVNGCCMFVLMIANKDKLTFTRLFIHKVD